MLAAEFHARLPAGVEVRAAGGNLLIYRPEIVRPILDSDSAFYRPNGEDDFAVERAQDIEDYTDGPVNIAIEYQ